MNRINIGYWSIILLFAMFSAGIVHIVAMPNWITQVITIPYVLFVPGFTFVKLLALKEEYIEWILGFALSIAFSMVCAELAIYLRIYSPEIVLGALLIINLCGWFLLHLPRKPRR